MERLTTADQTAERPTGALTTATDAAADCVDAADRRRWLQRLPIAFQLRAKTSNDDRQSNQLLNNKIDVIYDDFQKQASSIFNRCTKTDTKLRI